MHGEQTAPGAFTQATPRHHWGLPGEDPEGTLERVAVPVPQDQAELLGVEELEALEAKGSLQAPAGGEGQDEIPVHLPPLGTGFHSGAIPIFLATQVARS